MLKLVEKSTINIRNRKYLKLIYKAMDSIGHNYGAIITNYSKEGNDSNRIEICERNYIIFLSYILGKMDSNSTSSKISDKLYLNGEVYKRLDSMEDKEINKAFDRFNKLLEEKQKNKDNKCEEKQKKDKYKNVRPDFVIHKSHNEDYETKGQKLVIEAKTTSNLKEEDFCWDFIKLNAYIDNLKFKQAIYIIVNADIKDINKCLKSYSDKIKYTSNRIDRLWFFIQNWNGKNMDPIRLYQVEK